MVKRKHKIQDIQNAGILIFFWNNPDESVWRKYGYVVEYYGYSCKIRTYGLYDRTVYEK